MRRDVETYLASAGPAALPERYEAAKTALANCTKIDDCKDWADKAAALASYAHQSKARELENNCRRIRARATRHLGELLREIRRVCLRSRAKFQSAAHSALRVDRFP